MEVSICASIFMEGKKSALAWYLFLIRTTNYEHELTYIYLLIDQPIP